MKKCPYCGLENSDAAIECATCRASLQSEEPTETMNPQEMRFWQRMTRRQLALLIVRLQAVWLFFYAFVDLTYLPRYLAKWTEGAGYYAAESRGNVGLFLL